MHVYSCLSVKRNDDALQASHVFVVVDGYSDWYLVTTEKAAFQNIDSGCDGLAFHSWSTSVSSYEATCICHSVDGTDAVFCT